MEKRDFFPHWHRYFSAHPTCNTHTHTHTHTIQHILKEHSREQKSQFKLTVELRLMRGDKEHSLWRFMLDNWKLLAKCGGNWFSDVSKLETEGGGQDEKFEEWKVLTKLESHIPFLVGYRCVSPTSRSTLLWETPLQGVLSWSVNRTS